MHTTRHVNTAVFPAAGLCSRFLPATMSSPKETPPIVDQPLLPYAVEEAYAAGVRHMVFVTGRSKRAIEDPSTPPTNSKACSRPPASTSC